MFHEMSEQTRTALANMLRKCQNDILFREGSEKKPNALPGAADYGLTKELPPGTLHAYGQMEWALRFLTAPEVTEFHEIGGKGHLCFRHRFGCFDITSSGHRQWAITEHFMETPYPIWTLRKERESYWLTKYHKLFGDGTPVLVRGDSWLAVIDATREAD